MLITVEVKNCGQCRHRDHSGAFTKGGARQICGHSDACKARRSLEEFAGEYPMYANDIKCRKDWKYHWYNRIVNEKTIPDWCPLKHGSAY
jgi:hypothetical protein